jgi:hypothetical protein
MWNKKPRNVTLSTYYVTYLLLMSTIVAKELGYKEIKAAP